MKFTATLLSVMTLAIATVNAAPAPITLARRADVLGLLPDFGVVTNTPFPGMPPNTDCAGVNGSRIPCTCPPSKNLVADRINEALATGKVPGNPSVANVQFPTGNSNREQALRMNAALVIMQNLNGPGVGCPAVATNFVGKIAALGGL